MPYIIYTARKVHNDSIKLEEDLLRSQLNGEQPIFRNGNILVYEKLTHDNGSVVDSYDNGTGD